MFDSRLIDHWAHLGGAAFGIFYYFYGPGYWRRLRQDILDAEGHSN
jgi:rhomboid-like protein